MLPAKASPDHRLPSNAKFGWLFSAIFLATAVYAYTTVSLILAGSLLVLSLVTCVITVVAPDLLLPFNRLWFAFGNLLGKFVSPVILGIIFFLLITPVSLLTRMFGRDVLLMKKRKVDSYWVEREPACPAPESFKNQF